MRWDVLPRDPWTAVVLIVSIVEAVLVMLLAAQIVWYADLRR